jgi:predicted oxidoreductase
MVQVVGDDEVLSVPLTKDGQVTAIHNARRYRGDRLIRTAAPTGFSTLRPAPLSA